MIARQNDSFGRMLKSMKIPLPPWLPLDSLYPFCHPEACVSGAKDPDSSSRLSRIISIKERLDSE
jgi:hypothetical protein